MSLLTGSIIGYGDIVPVSSLEMICVMLFQLIGVIIFPVVMTQI